MKLSPKGLQLLLDSEVGGGRHYYEKFCSKPTVPGGPDTASGVTIGIGYDLGQASMSQFMADWDDFLDHQTMAKLGTVVGLHGDEAKRDLPKMREIVIPWNIALEQFETRTVQRFWTETVTAFPGIKAAPECVQEAMLSLVFNRGTSIKGPRRVEMVHIRYQVEAGQWSEIPAELRSMKRLWPASKGLRDRREAEAKHIETSLEQ